MWPPFFAAHRIYGAPTSCEPRACYKPPFCGTLYSVRTIFMALLHSARRVRARINARVHALAGDPQNPGTVRTTILDGAHTLARKPARGDMRRQPDCFNVLHWLSRGAPMLSRSAFSMRWWLQSSLSHLQ